MLDTCEFNRRMNNPTSVAEFILAMQIPGTAVYKRVMELQDAIMDEKALVHAIIQFFLELKIMAGQKDEEMNEEQLLRAYLKGKENICDYVMEKRKAACREHFNEKVAEYSGKPEAIKTKLDALYKEQKSLIENLSVATDRLVSSLKELHQVASEVDEQRAADFNAFLEEQSKLPESEKMPEPVLARVKKVQSQLPTVEKLAIVGGEGTAATSVFMMVAALRYCQEKNKTRNQGQVSVKGIQQGMVEAAPFLSSLTDSISNTEGKARTAEKIGQRVQDDKSNVTIISNDLEILNMQIGVFEQAQRKQNNKIAEVPEAQASSSQKGRPAAVQQRGPR